MATIAELVVSLVAETAQFVGGFGKADTVVTRFERNASRMNMRVRDMGQSLGALSSAAGTVSDVARSLEGVNGTVGELATGFDDVASGAATAATNVGGLKGAVSELKAVLASPVGKFSIGAIIMGLAGRWALNEETRMFEEQTRRDSRAPDNEFNRVGKQLEAEQQAIRDRQAAFAQSMHALAPAFARLHGMRQQLEKGGMTAGESAAFDIFEMFRNRKDVDMESVRALAKLAFDMAESIERQNNGLEKQRKITTENERRAKRSMQMGLFGGLPRMDLVFPKDAPQPVELSTETPSARMFGTQEAFMREANKPDTLTAIAQQQLDVQKDTNKAIKQIKPQNAKLFNINAN